MSVSGRNPPGLLLGWRQLLVEDFNTDCGRGKFIGNSAYPRWSAYKTGTPTTPPWKTGKYDNSILEVKNSCLILNVHTSLLGTPLTAALLPQLGSTGRGIRRSIRFKCEKLPGYKLAWLLWPNSGVWPRDGEIDFPECNLNGDTIKGFMHWQGGSSSDQSRATSGVNPCDGRWHTATTMWKPGKWRTRECTFILDGIRIGHFTDHVPYGPMHEVIQTEPELRSQKPSGWVSGRIWIDWYAGYEAA
jgi:hypothetical protein